VRGGDDLVTDDESPPDPAHSAEQVPSELVAELIDRYRAGATIEDLAASHPFSYRKVRGALIAAGVTLRPQKPRPKPAPPGLIRAYESGRTIQQVADAFGFSYNKTRRILVAHGVQIRRRGPR
jgi:hypothetical protein